MHIIYKKKNYIFAKNHYKTIINSKFKKKNYLKIIFSRHIYIYHHDLSSS